MAYQELDLCLTLSTAHLPPAERDCGLYRIAEYEFGAFMYVPEEGIPLRIFDDDDEYPVLVELLAAAKAAGARYLRIDSDGPIEPSLSTYQDDGKLVCTGFIYCTGGMRPMGSYWGAWIPGIGRMSPEGSIESASRWCDQNGATVVIEITYAEAVDAQNKHIADHGNL